jgi:hypothetical protein
MPKLDDTVHFYSPEGTCRPATVLGVGDHKVVRLRLKEAVKELGAPEGGYAVGAEFAVPFAASREREPKTWHHENRCTL